MLSKMENVSGNKTRVFLFQGNGRRYFVVWLGNLLLTLITFGIFLPWAMVRTRRYFYEHTELEGQRFSYHATGGSLFVGGLGFFILYIIFLVNIIHLNVGLTLCMAALFVLFFPWLVTQGLRYQFLMTQVNGVRFSFCTNPLRAWWVMLGCPLLIGTASVMLFSMIGKASMSSFSYSGIVLGILGSVVVLFLGALLMLAVYTAQWYGMLVNNTRYGKMKFTASYSVKECAKILFFAFLLFIPFFIIDLGIIFNMLAGVVKYALVYSGFTETIAMTLSRSFIPLVAVSVIYIAGMAVCFTFAFVKLRHYFYGQITLDNNIRFSSSISLGRTLWIIVSNFLLCVVTLCLAWPWAKVRLTRYLMENTHVHGYLTALNAEDHNEQPTKNPASLLARGLSFLTVTI